MTDNERKMKPILFSTPMVRALLNTRPNVWPAEPIDANKSFKSMTRRLIKPQPKWFKVISDKEALNRALSGFDPYGFRINTPTQSEVIKDAPYKPGDILWVRETWCKLEPEHFIETRYAYKANCGDESEEIRQEYIKRGYPYQWKPSIFMPREAARLFLEVKSVRVERLQNISEDDAQSEGIESVGIFNDFDGNENVCVGQTYREPFIELWNCLNAKRGYSWESNPWVWVYEFMRLDAESKEVINARAS